MKDYSKIFNDKVILITGGTGSFGRCFTEQLLKLSKPKKIIIFSRDEWKQWEMRNASTLFNHDAMRYFLGDVRDKERLLRSFEGVDYVVHAAALKQVPTAEYNPSEFIKTNVLGSMNVIEAAIDRKVKKVIALSTDKAVGPVNLYGASKLCADKLFVASNPYAGLENAPFFSVVRYGNVLGSRGSIIQHWQDLLKKGNKTLPVTDSRMTRFWISLEQATLFVMKRFLDMEGGEIFIPKIPSMKIIDLAKAMAPDIDTTICGIREGEKLHELLIAQEESGMSYEFSDHYLIAPHLFNKGVLKASNTFAQKGGKAVQKGFMYSSDGNSDWLNKEDLAELISI